MRAARPPEGRVTRLRPGGTMTSGEGWRAAVFSYNHDDDYVDAVARVANEYAAAIG